MANEHRDETTVNILCLIARKWMKANKEFSARDLVTATIESRRAFLPAKAKVTSLKFTEVLKVAKWVVDHRQIVLALDAAVSKKLTEEQNFQASAKYHELVKQLVEMTEENVVTTDNVVRAFRA